MKVENGIIIANQGETQMSAASAAPCEKASSPATAGNTGRKGNVMQPPPDSSETMEIIYAIGDAQFTLANIQAATVVNRGRKDEAWQIVDTKGNSHRLTEHQYFALKNLSFNEALDAAMSAATKAR